MYGNKWLFHGHYAGSFQELQNILWSAIGPHNFLRYDAKGSSNFPPGRVYRVIEPSQIKIWEKYHVLPYYHNKLTKVLFWVFARVCG